MQSTEFEPIGYYSPAEAAKLIQEFENSGVEFRAAVDESALRNPVQLVTGEFGNAVWVLISIDPSRREEVEKIHAGIFGDCLPNFGSTFFRKRIECLEAEGNRRGFRD